MDEREIPGVRASLRPSDPLFSISRIAWFEAADDQPRHAGSGRAAAAQPY